MWEQFLQWLAENGTEFINHLLSPLFHGVDLFYALGMYILESSLNIVVQMLTVSPYSGEWGIVYQNIVSSFGTAVSLVGTGVLVLVWMIGFLKNSSDYDHKDTMSTMFFQLARFFVPLALINSYQWIVSIFIQLFNDIIVQLPSSVTNVEVSLGYRELVWEFTDIQTGLDTIFTNGEYIVRTFTDNLGNPITSIINAILVIVIFVLCCSTSIKLIIAGITRMFKLYSIIIMAPLSLALFGSKETENMAVRYLTYLAKFALEAVMILAMIYIFALYRTNLPNLLDDIAPVFDLMPNLSVHLKAILDISILSALISGVDQLTDRIF